MGFFDIFFDSEETADNGEIWQQLETVEEFKDVLKESYRKTVVIFKHSTTCHISKIVKKNFEEDLKKHNPEGVSFYYLNLLHFRPISNLVANELKISHESPQILVIKNGEVVHHASHHSIDFENVLKNLN